MTSVQESNGTTSHATNGTAEKNASSAQKQDGPETVVPDSSNPYHFPINALCPGLEYKGVPLMRFPVKDDPITHIKKIENLSMREDDVIITVYPKCGTHWVAEILHMLTTGQTEYSGRTKEFMMLEFCDDLSFLETLPSPRLLNSHLYTAHLPLQMVEKRVKMVHVIRNPKDTAVSMYYHLKQSAAEEFNFENFMKGYPSGKYIAFSHQLDYLRQMKEFEKAHPEQPIIHIHFEDLKHNSAATIKELSIFLEKPASDDFCQKIASACGFSNMKKADEKREMPKSVQKIVKRKLQFYRKGIVGDWKNHFTVAQNEMFDEFLSTQEHTELGFSFKGQF